MLKVRDLIKEYYKNVVSNAVFYLPLIILIFISYSFTVFNRTVFLDDLAQEVYYGHYNHKLKALRWGQYLAGRIFSTTKFVPSLNKMFGIIFFVLTLISIGSLLYFFDQKEEKDVWKYSLFSCVFISYPLITDFFGFFEALTIPLQFFIVSFVLLYEVLAEKLTKYDHLFAGVLMSFVMSGYESLIFAYITEVFIVLFFKYVINNKNNEYKIKDWIHEGFNYAAPLFIALILKYVVGYTILFVTGLESGSDGNTALHWFSDGFTSALIRVIFNGYFYVLRGLSFFPITVFVIALIIFIIITIKYQKQSKHSLLISFYLLLSLFSLSLLQGDYLGYRQCQSLHVFIAYVAYLLYDELADKRLLKLSLKPVLIILLLFLSLRQSIYTHTLFALDNQRSDNEAYVIQNIGYKIYSEFDKNKTVIFCGLYDMGEFINSQIYPNENSLGGRVERYLKETFGYDEINVPFVISDNVFSVINWAYYPFYGQTMYKNMLSYYGYDININDHLTYDEVKNYTRIAEENNMKPLEVRDFGDYILVYFGPKTEHTNWNV